MVNPEYTTKVVNAINRMKSNNNISKNVVKNKNKSILNSNPRSKSQRYNDMRKKWIQKSIATGKGPFTPPPPEPTVGIGAAAPSHYLDRTTRPNQMAIVQELARNLTPKSYLRQKAIDYRFRNYGHVRGHRAVRRFRAGLPKRNPKPVRKGIGFGDG